MIGILGAQSESGHTISAPFIKRETSSSILAEKGKSWRPIGGAPELGREGGEEEEEEVMVVEEEEEEETGGDSRRRRR